MDAGLKIVIGADVNGAVAGINKVQQSLQKVPQSSNQATYALTNLSRVAQDAPFGFIAIANNINPLVDSFVALKKETGSTKGAFTAIASSLGGPGGLILVTGLVTAGLTILGKQLNKTGGDTDKLQQKIDDLKNNIVAIPDIKINAESGVQGDIALVESLAKAVTNSNLGYEKQKNALQELQRINKDRFGQFTVETAQYGALASAVQEYTNQLVNEAIVKGLQDEISTQSKLTSQLFKRLKVEKDVQNEAQRSFDIAQKSAKLNLGNNQGSFINEATNLENAKKTVNTTRQEILNAFSEITNLRNEIQNKINSKIPPPEFDTQGSKKTLVDEQDALNKINSLLSAGYADLLSLNQKYSDDKITKDALNFQEQLNRLEIEYTDALNKEKDLLYKNAAQKQQVLDTLSGLYEQKRVAIQLEADKALFINIEDGASKAGEKAADAWVEAWRKGLTDVKPPEIMSSENPNKSGFAGDPKQYENLAKAQERLRTSGFKIPITIDENNADALNKYLDQIQEKLEVTRSIVGKFAPAFTDLFNTILTGGKDAFQQFGQAIKQLIIQLISSAAAAAVLAGIISAITGTPFDVNFKAAFTLTSGIKFAQGGIVNKPTYGLFGEAGAEAVIPLDRLGNMLSNAINYGFNASGVNSVFGSSNDKLVAEVKGSDLAFVLARNNKTVSRLG